MKVVFDLMLTCLEPAIQPGWPIGHDGLDLEELLLTVVAPHNGEAQAPGGLD